MQNRHKLPREKETIKVLLIVVQIRILHLQTLAYIMPVLAPTTQQVVTSWLPSYEQFWSMATPACMMAKFRPWRRCRCFKHSYGKNRQSEMQASETFWRESLITTAPDILFSSANSLQYSQMLIPDVFCTLLFLQKKDWPSCRSATAGCWN